MRSDDPFVRVIVSSTGLLSPEPSVLTHPALQRRWALRDRRPSAARRHTGRVATRFAVLLAGDILAIALARGAAFWLVTETADGLFALSDSPLLSGGTRLLLFALITLASVFTAGGHSRHRALNQPIRLFGAVVGTMLLMYAGGIARLSARTRVANRRDIGNRLALAPYGAADIGVVSAACVARTAGRRRGNRGWRTQHREAF